MPAAQITQAARKRHGTVPARSAIERGQFDQHARADDVDLQLPEQRMCRGHGAAGGQHVIDQQHARIGRQRVGMQFEEVLAVFECIDLRQRAARQFARLAHRYEARTVRVPMARRG